MPLQKMIHHQIIELAQEYIKQNGHNVQQALNEINNEIHQSEEEYRSLLQHQTDQSNLILDLQQQSVQLQQEITQQIQTLKTFNQNSENDPDLMLLEKIGFCKANLNKTENLLNKIKDIYVDFTVLTNSIAEGEGLNTAQGQLTQMEAQIDELLGDTSQRYLKQSHVNQRCLPQNIIHSSEQDVGFLKKYFAHFGQYRKALDQFMIHEAPLGLIATIEAGNDSNVTQYIEVLLTQEELQMDSLRGIFPRIAQEVINGIGQYLSYLQINNDETSENGQNLPFSTKLQKELDHLKTHFQAIVKLRQIIDQMDAVILQEHYKTKATRGYGKLSLTDYLDFSRLLAVSLHFCVHKHLVNLINYEIQQKNSQIALLLKDVLIFIQSYNDMLEELRIDYTVIRYAELTNNLQLISNSDVLGIRPHQFVRKELENILAPDVLGQIMSQVIKNDFYQQFKNYWEHKASSDDKKLILQSIQLNKKEKEIIFNEAFFKPICRLEQQDLIQLMEDQYKEYVKNKFDQIANDQYQQYYKNVSQATIRTNTFNDFLQFINGYYSVLKIKSSSLKPNQIQDENFTDKLKYQLSYAVNESIIRFLSSILNDLEVKCKPMNYQYLAGLVEQEQMYKNYFIETKQVLQKKTNLEKIISQLPDPNFDYQLLKQRNLQNYKSKHGLLEKQKSCLYYNNIDFTKICQQQPNFYLIIATDMDMFIQNYKMLDKDNNQVTQQQEQKIKILANAILTHCVCKYVYYQLLPLNNDFSKLYVYSKSGDDSFMDNEAIWNVAFTFINQVIQHFDSLFTKKNLLLKQKFIDQIHLTLHACSYGNYLFKRQNTNNTEFDDELNRDCMCFSKFCQEFKSLIAQNSIKILQILRQPYMQSTFNENGKKLSPYLILLYSSNYQYLEDILDFDSSKNLPQDQKSDANIQIAKQQAKQVQSFLLGQQIQDDFYHLLDASPLERVFKNYAL